MKRVLIHILLITLAGVVVLPLVWLLCAAFKTGEDLFDYVLLPWNHLNNLTISNFTQLFLQRGFGDWLINSLFLASTSTVCVVMLSSLGGFALAKYRFRGRRILQVCLLATVLLPWQVLLPGSYELMHRLHWIDSYWAILLPGAVSVFGTFLFRQAMMQVPDELLQCGRLDGCSELRLWWEIALPTVRPMIGAYTLLSFLSAWNSFLWPQIVLQNEAKFTLPIAMANMLGSPQYQQQFGVVMAGAVISILPVMVLFFLLQGDFLPGLSSGAIKE